MDDDKPRHFPNTLSDREDALDAAAEARVRQRLVQEAGRCAAKQPRKDPSVYTGECGVRCHPAHRRGLGGTSSHPCGAMVNPWGRLDSSSFQLCAQWNF